MASESPQNRLRQAITSPTFALHAAIILGTRGLGGLEQQARNEIELHREPRATVHHEAGQESRARKELFAFSRSP